MAEAGARPETAGGEPDSYDDLKREFREALDHKRAQHADQSADRKGTGLGKIHGPHGPARGRRSFRRKSG